MGTEKIRGCIWEVVSEIDTNMFLVDFYPLEYDGEADEVLEKTNARERLGRFAMHKTDLDRCLWWEERFGAVMICWAMWDELPYEHPLAWQDQAQANWYFEHR